VPHVDAAIGERVRARIRARDVSLSIRKPAEISILNVLPARVAAIDENETGPIVDLQLAVGHSTLVARITRRSFRQLGIRTGQELYALVKAVSFDQRSVGYA
jgi:molybdate transport system ATP-binding protein